MIVAAETTETMVLKENNLTGIITGLILSGVSIMLLVFIHPWTLNLGMVITGVITLVGITGLAEVLLSQAYEVTFNKPAKSMIFKKTAVLGSKTNTFSTDGLDRIELRQKHTRLMTAATGGFRSYQPQLQSQIFMVFNNHQETALDHMKQSNSFSWNGLSAGTSAEGEFALGNKISNFLGVPFQNLNPSTWGGHF